MTTIGADQARRLWSSSSPMFTGFSAQSNRPSPPLGANARFRLSLNRAGERQGRQNGHLRRAASTSPGGPAARTARHGKNGTTKTPRQIKRYVTSAPPPPCGFEAPKPSETGHLNNSLAGGRPRPWALSAGNPRNGKTLKSTPLGHFYEFSRRPDLSKRFG